MWCSVCCVLCAVAVSGSEWLQFSTLQTDFAAYRRHKDRAARMPQNLLSNLIVATMPPICREFHDQASSVI